MKNSRVSNRGSAMVAIALIGSLGLGAANAVHAAEEDTFVVDASGLDLRSIQDTAVLYSKLRYAAETVCGLHEAHGYATRRQARRCVDSTLEAAVASVGARPLRARHYAESRAVRRAPAEVAVATTASVATARSIERSQ